MPRGQQSHDIGTGALVAHTAGDFRQATIGSLSRNFREPERIRSDGLSQDTKSKNCLVSYRLQLNSAWWGRHAFVPTLLGRGRRCLRTGTIADMQCPHPNPSSVGVCKRAGKDEVIL